jgi:DNA repair protein RecN (Recombination protein N)
VNLTSQNETQQLNKESYQLEILDAVVAKPSLLLNYQDAFSSFSSLKKEIASLEAEQIQLQNDFDFHSYQLNEIEEAQLEGENLETLEKELATLRHRSFSYSTKPSINSKKLKNLARKLRI